MKKEYDLSKLKSRPNHFAKQLKKQITIGIEDETIDYFQAISDETGFPFTIVVNLYLKDCVQSGRKINLNQGPAHYIFSENIKNEITISKCKRHQKIAKNEKHDLLSSIFQDANGKLPPDYALNREELHER